MNDALYKKRLFRLHRVLDWISLLSASAFIFPWFFVLFVPVIFLAPVHSLFFAKRLKREQAKQLRRAWSLPFNVRLRRSKREDCYVHGSALFSVLFVTNSASEAATAPETIRKIDHELGHHGRMDFAAYAGVMSCVTLALFWIFAIVYTLVFEWETMSNPGAFVIVLGILFAGVAVLLLDLRRLLNFRELNADNHAYRKNPADYTDYLDRLAFVRTYYSRTLRNADWALDFIHPAPRVRLAFLTEPTVHNGYWDGWWVLPFVAAALAALHLSLNPYSFMSMDEWRGVFWFVPYRELVRDIAGMGDDLRALFLMVIACLGGLSLFLFGMMRRARMSDEA